MDHLIPAALIAALLAFLFVGLRARRPTNNLDDYLTARNSQPASTLALSFVASGLGAWILFVPPEIGAFVGPIALTGYALAAALPFLILVWYGPVIRQRMPAGQSLAQYAEFRFGPGMRAWTTGLSLLYMLCFITAELTALTAVVNMTGKIPGHWVMLGVALTTLAYTSLGGLRASLATDRLQAWLILGLIALVAASLAWALASQPIALQPMPAAPTPVGLSVALTLIIAVAAANFFHQGYWQRMWSAQSDAALRQGSAWAAGITIVVILLVGGMGMLAVMLGKNLGQPPAPFFALTQGLNPWIGMLVALLATALVASSIDTLQCALASLLLTRQQSQHSHAVRSARWLTVLLMVPVVAMALQNISVLRIFLIADLLCASAIVPMLLGLWKKMTPPAAMAGCVAGLIGAVLPGWASSGTFTGGVMLASFPSNTPTLAPFAGALLASAATAVMLALVSTKLKSRP